MSENESGPGGDSGENSQSDGRRLMHEEVRSSAHGVVQKSISRGRGSVISSIKSIIKLLDYEEGCNNLLEQTSRWQTAYR